MKNLFNVLEQAISAGVGFKEAEQIYSESFKSPESFSIQDEPKAFDCMFHYLTSDVYPVCDDEEYNEYYDPEPIAKGCTKEEATVLINSGMRFVYVCNYKGEEDGIMPECLTKNMRVFVSKYNYIRRFRKYL